jgi:hypothetical protein
MKRTSFALFAFVCSTVFALTGCVSEVPVDESDYVEEEESVETVDSALAPALDPTCYAIDKCFNSSSVCGWSHYTQTAMGMYYADNC